jgi:putative redox protein
MDLILERIEPLFGMELTNEAGQKCRMDASPAIGGKDSGFRPMELLAGSLAGCISVDVINILKKQRFDLKHYAIRIHAKRLEATPSPFESIHLIFEFDDQVDPVKVERAIDLAKNKYCSVSASLSDQIKITYEVKIV